MAARLEPEQRATVPDRTPTVPEGQIRQPNTRTEPESGPTRSGVPQSGATCAVRSVVDVIAVVPVKSTSFAAGVASRDESADSKMANER